MNGYISNRELAIDEENAALEAEARMYEDQREEGDNGMEV